MKIEPRDVVYVPVGPHNKPHPAVVLEAAAGEVIVISGTGTQRDYPCVVVQSGTRHAKALRLTKDTYFYEAGIAAVSLLATTRTRPVPTRLVRRPSPVRSTAAGQATG